MKVFIWPRFGKESGQGGIKRVWEAQHRWLPEYGVDIVSSPEAADLIAVHADEYKTDRPIAYHCHGLYWEGYDWDRWCYVANEKLLRAMRQANGVSVPSKFVRHSLSRGMLLNPVVLYHGVDVEEWEPAKNDGYVLWAKNRPDPICDPTPVSVLAKSCPDTQFVSTFGEAGLSNLRLLGRVHYSDSKRLIQHAAAYLATVQETGGITVLEAMASGVPPVGFDYGANSELIEHGVTGVLVQPGDYAGLREGLYYALQHRTELGDNARQFVRENFSWAARMADYAPFYASILEGIKHDGPAVSVILTAYNLAGYLPAAIGSILDQKYADWELIVVDDASPDDCGIIADEYAARDSRIRVIHNRTNAYLAEARNIGIRHSRGRYIICLDADDQLAPNTLAAFSAHLDRNRDVDIVTGDFWLVEPDGRAWQSGWPSEHPTYDQQIKHRNQVFYASMYRRWVWERTGGYRRRMRSAEDAEFWTRAMSYGAVPAKVSGFPSLVYSNRPNSMSHTIAEPDWTGWFTWAKYPQLTPFGASGTPPNKLPSRPVQPYGPAEVTVVVPVGPGHDWYLQDCLDSLVAQSMQNWRVVVVNDTGTRWFDDRDKLLNPYLQGYPFATYLDSEGKPGGPAQARNRGIQAAETEAIVLLDADDIAQPLLLDSLYMAWKTYGGWVYTDWYDQEGNYKESKDWDADRMITKMLGPVTGIYSKAAWEKVGGFDELAPGWEDWNFQLSLMEIGECGMRLAIPGFTYRYHAGTRREEDFAQKETLLQYIRSNHTKLYEGKNLMGGCCGGTARKTVSISDPEVHMDMVEIQYIGQQEQQVKIKSKALPGVRYTYWKGKQFFVHKDDLVLFENNSQFQIVKQATPTGVVVGEVSVLTAETRPAPVQDVAADVEQYILSDEISVDKLNLPSLVRGVLKREGYTTVESVKYASDVELLSAKGISDTRLKQIRKAVDAL